MTGPWEQGWLLAAAWPGDNDEDTPRRHGSGLTTPSRSSRRQGMSGRACVVVVVGLLALGAPRIPGRPDDLEADVLDVPGIR